MLVLTRKIGETIRIGDDIEVSVSAILGDKVKLAFSAPGHITVHRQEVYDAIHASTNPKTTVQSKS